MSYPLPDHQVIGNQLNFFAWLNNMRNNALGILTNAGAPTSGTSGTFNKVAGPGCLLIDITNKVMYMNTNTKASPTWTALSSLTDFALPSGDLLVGNASNVATAVALSGDATIDNAGALSLAASVLKTASGTISSANITGTSAGQLGHANGVEMVAAGGAHVVNEWISTVLINDFGVAAYTAGGNLTVNIGSGGAALSGLINNAGFIQSAADKIIEFVPLAATINTYTENKGINLVSSVAPTNPGTAAGVFRYFTVYRQIATGL